MPACRWAASASSQTAFEFSAGRKRCQIGNAGKDGVTVLQAGNNLNLGTVTTASSNSLSWDANNYRKDSTTTEVGSQVQATGSIVLKAGADINARAVDVQAGTSLSGIAGNNLNVVAGVNAVTVDEGHQRTESGFMHDELITTRDTLDRSSALGSSLGRHFGEPDCR
ncbi:hemagglutinin repeat-containing protein [Collimonas fungivorans]|uniref:hemagglutinin repeat-containing protein n=1 Tax=Collimonas fungivorans TaxID=158899 RepID=UPI0026F270C1|nr:hemagglutinin repeat-containing protein [Collimonas fungivorans]